MPWGGHTGSARAYSIAVMLLIGSSAAAAPLEQPMLWGGAVFSGPTHPHATAVYLNPAALGLSEKGQHLTILSTFQHSIINIDRQNITSGGVVSPGGDATAQSLVPGGLIAWDFQAASNARIGLALYTPLHERYISDEPALRYHTLGGYMLQTTGTLSFSFNIGNKVFLGAGIGLGHTAARLKFARDTALEAGSAGLASDCGGSPCGIENPQAEQTWDVSASTGFGGGLFSSANLALSVGTVIRLAPKTWLGISVVTPAGSCSLLSALIDFSLECPTTLALEGDVTVDRAPRDGGGTLTGKSEISFRTPPSFFVGVRGPLVSDLEWTANARVQSLSRHRDYDIRTFGNDLPREEIPTWYPRFRGLRTVWSLDGGVERGVGSRFRYGGRLRLESGGVETDHLAPTQVAWHNITVQGAGELRVADHLVLTANYALTAFPTRQSNNSAFDPAEAVGCVDSGFDYDACAAVRSGRAIPSASGSYSRLDQTLLLSVRYDTL